MPRVDADGNDLGGIRPTALAAPLGTYTGWTLRRAGFGEDELAGLWGSFIPFAKTKAEREASQIRASPSKKGMRPMRDTFPPSAERRSSCKLTVFFWKKMQHASFMRRR